MPGPPQTGTPPREPWVPYSRFNAPAPAFPAQKRKTPPKRGLSNSFVDGSAGNDADGAAALRALHGELDLAIDQREQRVVAAEADAHARMELGATLANDDVAGIDRLATINLHAEILRVGVAAVARGTYALFMCHGCFSFLLVATGNAGDLSFGCMLLL